MARPILHPSGANFSYAATGTTISFPATTSLQLQAIPQYDSSKRLVKYMRYRLTVDVILLPEDLGYGTNNTANMDAAMVIIKRVLGTPGGTLKLHSLGFGTSFQVSSLTDLEFGPRPLEIRVRPVGGTQAMHIFWVIEFTLSNCVGTDSGEFLEFTYGIEFQIDERGLVQRTINIVAEFLSRRAGNTITNSPDSFLTQFHPLRLPGFQRTVRRAISPDKRIINYTVTDTEIPSDNPYPYGLTYCDLRHSLRNTMSVLASGNFAISISGTLEHAPGYTKAICWEAFRLIVREKLRNIHLAVVPDGSNKKSALILRSISIEDEIFTRRINVSVSWTMITKLDSLFASSGMFNGIQTNWNVWAQSIEAVTGPYGRLGLRHKPTDEALINICSGGIPRKKIEKVDTKAAKYQYTPITGSTGNNWDWQYYLELHGTSGAMTISTTGGGDATAPAPGWSLDPKVVAIVRGVISGATGSFLGSFAPQANKNADVVQDRTSTTWKIVFRATVWKTGPENKPPDLPIVTKIGGKQPVLVDGSSRQPRVIDILPEGMVKWQGDVYYVFTVPEFKGTLKIELSGVPEAHRFLNLSDKDLR